MFRKTMGWVVAGRAVASCIVTCLLWAVPALAQTGFVDLGNGRSLYVDHLPAKPGQRTLVVLNGLTYSTNSWNKLMPGIQGQGYGILRYDPKGMGRTLDKYGAPGEKIAIEAQADDLSHLLDALKIPGKVDLLGLSYGGGLAMVFASQFPERVEKMILMAPYVAPVEGQDNWIKGEIGAFRIMFPLYPKGEKYDDDLYDLFLHQMVYATYPAAEPVVLRRPYTLEGVFRMVQGIRKIDVTKLAHLFPLQSIHLMIGGSDQYIDSKVHDRFWNSLPLSSRMSRIVLDKAEHKIPEAVPNFTAAWVNLIMTNDSRLQGGVAFEGVPKEGVARSGQVEIRLPKDSTP